MAVTLLPTDMLRTKYTERIQHEYEQRTTRFKGMAELIANVQGERYEWPLLGGMHATEYSEYWHETSPTHPKLGKRSIRKRKFEISTDISDEIAEDMAPLEWSLATLLPKQMNAMERKWDEAFLGVEPIYLVDGNGDLVLDEDRKPIPTGKYQVKTSASAAGGFCGGLLGPNYVGEGGLEQANLDLSYTNGVAGKNLIPVDYSLSGSGISSALSGTLIERLIYVKRKLEEQEVFTGTEGVSVCFAISPAVKQVLCSLELAVNRDYGFQSLMENGAITFNKFLNVNFVVTNMLPTMNTTKADGTPVNNARMCVAWLKDRVGVATWKETTLDIRQKERMVDSKYLQIVKTRIGASRKDEDTTFVLPVVEAA